MGLFDRFFGPPDRDQFARMMMDAIQKAGETAPLRYDAEQYRLLLEGEKNELNLVNAYNEYCTAPKDRREVVFRNFVRTWFTYRRETPEEFEDVRTDLLPGIRTRMSFEIAGLRLEAEKGAKLDWPYRVLAESLGVGLVYDLPESMMWLQQPMLDKWDVTFDRAIEVACGNLRDISRNSMEQVGPGIWRSPWRDNYDPSRMLLHDFIRSHEVAGDPVVMVPNRDTLLLAGSEDEQALENLAALAEEAYEHPRPISGMVYCLSADNQWLPFTPGDSRKFKVLRIKSVGRDYAEQTEALKALHDKTGQDVFVAAFSAMEKHDTGEIRSYCVWSKEVSTYLPRTDDIFFFMPDGKEGGDVIATVPWERAQAVLGGMMKPLGLYPERYLVEDFPAEDQLAALR